ncbi:hypothetical protein WJX74_008539 [Apatococcus lobatus]|uniref:Pirin n=1 Tax=Apatococcus lobatus TaxID=904363 RepID=A0AAW1QYW5_9CHLO
MSQAFPVHTTRLTGPPPLVFLWLFTAGLTTLLLYGLLPAPSRSDEPAGTPANTELFARKLGVTSLSTPASRRPGVVPVVPLAAMPAVPGSLRQVTKVVQGTKQMEGAGTRICRTIGTPALRNLDPFLMLDELKCPADQASAGFPDHPHRGFETCSIMLSGEMEHYDSAGNHGIIGPGGVQWMTAGRGLVHSEMPHTKDGMMWGFQLWINLPAKDKMVKPRYQDYQADEIPSVRKDGATVRVMAGESWGTIGPIKLRNPGFLLDVTLQKGGRFVQPVPPEWTTFAYVCQGSGRLGSTDAKIEQTHVFGEGDHVEATSEAEDGMRFLLLAGRPIGEPIVQYGPFVMNTQQEIQQAFHDYQSGQLQSKDDNPWVE